VIRLSEKQVSEEPERCAGILRRVLSPPGHRVGRWPPRSPTTNRTSSS
jgi:hypothetical protein